MDPLSFLFKVATHTAGSRLREIQQNKERAEAERRALWEKARREQAVAEEKAREDRDPVYRAAKNAERAKAAAQRVRDAARQEAEAVAYAREQKLRTVQRWMFWLSFASFIVMLCSTYTSSGANTEASAAPFLLSWLIFSMLWLCLCFVPKRFP